MEFQQFITDTQMLRAIDELGFTTPTEIQARAIPAMREGTDVIARSQTGTGKTFAFVIPAIEAIDREAPLPCVQVLILCPTRELTQQGMEEIKKLTRYMLGIWPVDVYGGAPIERQISKLSRCNMVIGTPGRVMDHMRRGTLSLENVKLVILDEADEMLSMGFREDIETILKDTPATRQTVLFSATMPEEILELTEQYQNDPCLIEVAPEQVTLEKIHQMMIEVPMGRKLDALLLVLHAYAPKRAMLFCNTKAMVDEVNVFLNKNGFTCEAIHGDMNQSQRTRVMEGFKAARLPLLVATDVAARGIDVSDVDYVINYDIPVGAEPYVHRIGRTARAGKEGNAITFASGRRQMDTMRNIARATRSEIETIPIPNVEQIRKNILERNLEKVQNQILNGISHRHMKLVEDLLERGYDLTAVAAAALDIGFGAVDESLKDIEIERKASPSGAYRKLILNIGRSAKVAPNHIVSALAEKGGIRGALIGKIEIYDDRTVVGIPEDVAKQMLPRLEGLKICGKPVRAVFSTEKPKQDRYSPTPVKKRDYAPAHRTEKKYDKSYDKKTQHRPTNGKRFARSKHHP